MDCWHKIVNKQGIVGGRIMGKICVKLRKGDVTTGFRGLNISDYNIFWILIKISIKIIADSNLKLYFDSIGYLIPFNKWI